MSRINEIQTMIKSLSPGAYQKLMDAYLHKKYEFENIETLGMQAGTDKTTKGTPDSYVKLENGKYIFIMHGSVEKTSFDKIRKDINSCFDEEKVKLQKSEIDKIICCHTSSDITPEQYEILCGLHPGIKIELIGIGTVSHDLENKYPYLAKDHLDIDLDTGQILDLEGFVKKSDKNNMNAPLDIACLHREQEIDKLVVDLENEDMILVCGQSGIGKTRLVIETCREYKLKFPNINILCIKSNGQNLYDDLKMYLSAPGEYILFVDDANQVTMLSHITDYIIDPPEGIKVKLILTVRDYARENVISKVSKVKIPYIITIDKLSDESIKEILRIEFEIINYVYIDKILTVASGNIRLAVMAAISAKNNGYKAIENSIDIFKNYYSTILGTLEFNRKKIIIAFVITLLGPIEYKSDPVIKSILDEQNISELEYHELCLELNNDEIIDLFQERAAKISDQSLGNYLLYYVLIDTKYIVISEILKKCFKAFRKKIIYALNTLHELFGSQELIGYIDVEINKVWDEMIEEFGEIEVIRCFYSSNELKTLSYFKKKFTDMSVNKIETLCLKDITKQIDLKDEDLYVLGDFKYSKNYEIVLQLIFLYFDKNPNIIGDLYFLFTKAYGYDEFSSRHEYEREYILIEKLWEDTKFGEQYHKTMLLVHLIKYYLQYNVNITETKNNTLRYGTMSLRMCDGLQSLRKLIWDILGKLYKDNRYTGFINEVLKDFSVDILHDIENSKQIFEHDLDLVKENIFANITEPDFAQYLVIKKFIEHCCRLDINYLDFTEKYKLNKDYILFEAIAPVEVFRGKYDIKEENRAKIQSIVSSYTDEDFMHLFAIYKQYIENIEENDSYIRRSIDMIFSIMMDSKDRYLLFLDLYFKSNMSLNIFHNREVSSMIKYLGINETEEKLMSIACSDRHIWYYEFLCSLEEKDIKEKHITAIEELILEELGKEKISISFELKRIIRYINKSSNILEKISRRMLERGDSNIIKTFLQFYYYIDDAEIDFLLDNFKCNLGLLCDLYIMVKADNVDCNNKLFMRILLEEPTFLEKFIIALNTRKIKYLSDTTNFDIIWENDNYNKLIQDIFDLICKHEEFVSIIHFRFEWFFQTGKNDETDNLIDRRKVEWVKEYISKNCNDSKLMRLIFNIVSSYMTIYRIEIILYFLEKNSDVKTFTEIELFPSVESWSGSEVLLLDKKIEFLSKLNEKISNDIDFIEHKAYLQDIIGDIKLRKEEVLLTEYLSNLDNI